MRTWLECLDKLELEAPYVVIGKALCRADIIRQELWSDAPDFLQQGQLREELVGTGIKVSDISVVGGTYKQKDRPWWLTQDSVICNSNVVL